MFSDQLKEEKNKSRLTIDKLMAEAEVAMKETHDLATILASKEKEIEDERSASKQRQQAAVREERSFSSRVLAICKLLFSHTTYLHLVM